MPLTDLVRHLNARHAAGEVFRTPAPFVATPGGDVQLHFAGLCIESLFLPVVDTRHGHPHGHAASLRVSGLASGQPVAAEAVFVLPGNDAEFIQLDRLVRTLHALNYLTQRIRGNLLLSVHPRHVLSVSDDHGLAFEEILRPCGLLPTEITLEIDVAGMRTETQVQRDWQAHLIRAIGNYRSRGYAIALRGIGHDRSDLPLLRALAPQIIRLDPPLLASGQPLGRLVAPLRNLDARLLIDGAGLAEHAGASHWGDIDLVQAAALGKSFPAVAGRARNNGFGRYLQRSAA